MDLIKGNMKNTISVRHRGRELATSEGLQLEGGNAAPSISTSPAESRTGFVSANESTTEDFALTSNVGNNSLRDTPSLGPRLGSFSNYPEDGNRIY